jgi:N-acyl homoserine lactone hydrolase
MKLRQWMTVGALSLGATGMGLTIKSLLPQHLGVESSLTGEVELPHVAQLPDIDIFFLRCASTRWPEPIMVRGSGSFAPCTISFSAVLVRHPAATFLYDTGLCSDIYLFLMDQSLSFRQTLARFTFEQSLASHLQQLEISPGEVDFALISHLHWDHVSGVPDLPGVPLRINQVEYEAARAGLFERYHGLVPRLMDENPLELFALDGPSYAGFSASLDLFGDGSIVLVPLPGHTAGNTGMFIRRAHGQPLFLLGDAAMVSQQYIRPTTAHPLFWSRVTSDPVAACQTLVDLHYFSQKHPEIPLIAMHDAQMQKAFMLVEQSRTAVPR